MWDTVAVVGVGLIGGSLGMGLGLFAAAMTRIPALPRTTRQAATCGSEYFEAKKLGGSGLRITDAKRKTSARTHQSCGY